MSGNTVCTIYTVHFTDFYLLVVKTNTPIGHANTTHSASLVINDQLAVKCQSIPTNQIESGRTGKLVGEATGGFIWMATLKVFYCAITFTFYSTVLQATGMYACKLQSKGFNISRRLHLCILNSNNNNNNNNNNNKLYSPLAMLKLPGSAQSYANKVSC